MKAINNFQPTSPNLISTEVGYTMMRFTHASPIDLDVVQRSAWAVVQGADPSTAVRTDVPYEGSDYFYLSSLPTDTIFDIKIALVDELIAASEPLLQAQYTDPTVLSLKELIGLKTKKPVEITNILTNVGGLEIGAPPSTVTLELEGEASNIVIEASPTGQDSWSLIYSGTSASSINVTLQTGSYDFRCTSVFIFADNTVDLGGTSVYSGVVDVGSGATAPNAATNLVFSAFKELDTSSSYNLLLSWGFDGTGGGAKRHFNIAYIEIDEADDINTVDFSAATTVVSVGDSYAFTDFPYRKHYAFKVEVAGWNNNLSTELLGKAYITEETEGVAHEVLPTIGSYSPDTKIQVDSRYIRGYKEYSSPVSNIKTFEIDAATGNVTIGSAGQYGPDNTIVTTPFLFDADNARLAIAGQTITDEIISASFVMGWISGSSPTFRTKNKTSYADGTSGIWMGYTDSGVGDFKVDIGDALNYVRWTGDTLQISGSVVITDPNDNNAVIGSLTDIASGGSVPVTIYREDPNYFSTGAINNPVLGNTEGTALVIPDINRDSAEPITISIKLEGANANGINVSLNGTPVGITSNGVSGDRWYHFQGTSVSGSNSIAIWDTQNDSVVLKNLVVTYGTPSSASATPAGWETTKPADITVPTVISTANVVGSSLVGSWTVPTTLAAIDGIDGNRGNFIDYIYKVSSEEPDKPADYDGSPAGWNPDIPIHTETDIVWVTQATRDGTGVIIVPWTNVTRWSAYNGQDGNPGAGFYSQSFPYIDSNAQTVQWSAVSDDDVVAGNNATDFFLRFFNRAPAEHEVITQYNGNDASDSNTYMFQSGTWTQATATVHGDMIVDGSVRAQSIIADNLSAIRAELGDVRAGSIRLSDINQSDLSLDIVFNDLSVDSVVDFVDKQGTQAFQLSADSWENNLYQGRIGKDSIDSVAPITVDTRKALNPYYLGEVDTARIGPVSNVTSGQYVTTGNNSNSELRTITSIVDGTNVQLDCAIHASIDNGVSIDGAWAYGTPKWSVQLQKKVGAGSWNNLGSATTYTGSSFNFRDKISGNYVGGARISATHSHLDTLNEGDIVEYRALITRVDGLSSGTYIDELSVSLDANVNAFKENEMLSGEDGYFVDKDTGFCVQWGRTNAVGGNLINNTVMFPRPFTTVFSVVGSSTEIHLSAHSCHPTSWTNNSFKWVNGAGIPNRLGWIAIGII